MWENIKRLGENEHIFVSVLLVVVAASAFGLGRQSVVPRTISQQASIVISESVSPRASSSARIIESVSTDAEALGFAHTPQPAPEYVASRSGTRFHHITCSGAKQIKEENKLFFATPEAAMAAGYTRAANCQR